MKNQFVPGDVDYFKNEVHSLQSAYKEAIQKNMEFEEVKKIYEHLKQREKELEKAMEKNKGPHKRPLY